MADDDLYDDGLAGLVPVDRILAAAAGLIGGAITLAAAWHIAWRIHH